MTQQDTPYTFPAIGDGSGLAPYDSYHEEEVQLALRNSAMLLEALRYPITPIGMHYLLIHFDVPYVDVQDWRLNVGGLVSEPLSLTLDEIKARPSVTLAVTMECGGNGRALLHPRPLSQPWMLEAIGTAEWTGTPLRGILEDAGISPEAVEVLFVGLDKGIQGNEAQSYDRSLSIAESNREEALLVYEMNGEPLPPQHGYPLRLIVPGWYGMTSVKWLDRIEVIKEPFKGYQMVKTYRYSQTADELGEPVTVIRVRALMIPPGIPDFMSRTRVVEPGPVTLRGRAWAGRLSISRVEVSTDGGSTWSDAKLDEQPSPFAWRGWSYEWDAKSGNHTLCVRATDSEENVQPIEQAWTFQGMGNNMVQRIKVVVM
ncbi:MAG: sulfite oxidase [Chloroflexi bacterium]|nr:sulfite oxidase [Chloroflexota bacterium]